MTDQTDRGDASHPTRIVPENPSNDYDVEASDGSIIRHRLVYVGTREQHFPLDYRANALVQATAVYNSSYFRFNKEEDSRDPAEVVLEIAEKFHAFLTQDRA